MSGDVLAVDVGGTSIKAARVDADGRILHRVERRTPVADGPAAVVEALRSVAHGLADPALEAAGVVVPGSVDAAAGIARYAANIGWRDVPLRELLCADLGVPVVVEHDVRAAGLAERLLGRAREAPDCLVLVIGTGIAGVIVSGSTVLYGAVGLAGEVGHMPVHPEGEVCACGQRGCLETYASATAVARRYRAAGGGDLDTPDIVAARSSDPIAARVWQDATAALGIGLAACTMLLDPAVIVLGGGLAAAGAVLRDPVRTELAGRLSWRAAPLVELSPLGQNAGLLGAAILAARALGRDDFSTWIRTPPGHG